MEFSFNERQLAAIEHAGGPLLVVAGAGTGKTTVLVERIARLISQGHARPGEILAVTYTDNAAEEMHRRVQQGLAGTDCSPLLATTFHAYCLGLLSRHGRGFGVVDEQDLWIYLRRRLAELKLNYFTRAVNPAEFLNALLDFFSRCHDELVDVEEYEDYVRRLADGSRPLPRVAPSKKSDGLSEEDILARCREIAAVYRRVEAMLRSDGLGTFGHMILRAVQLLREQPEVLAAEQARARFILIDEFQDANLAQIELAELLAGRERNLFAVGDPDQAIYRFRGASSAAFEEFAHRFPGTKVVTLEDNQRSRTPVLQCAHAVIANNPAPDLHAQGFARRALRSARELCPKGQARLSSAAPAEIVICPTEQEEAGDVASVIDKLLIQPRRDSDSTAPRFGVLYRSHAHRDELVRELAARGIPFSVKGVNALETGVVRDLIACLRAIQSASDTEALFRVAALPKFGIEAEAIRERLAAQRDAPFDVVLQQTPHGAAVLKELESVRKLSCGDGMGPGALLPLVLWRFGFDASDPAVVAFVRFVKNWLMKPITRTGELGELLEYLDYYPDAGGLLELPLGAQNGDPDAVRLMTAHAAKGLEFDHVFVLRASQGSFPANYRERWFEFPRGLQKSHAAEGESKEVQRQEERRLFYVAMTRARDSLAILAKPGRGKSDPRPLGFLRDLMEGPGARKQWRQRTPVPLRLDFAAAAAPVTGVGAWLLAPPSPRLTPMPLSATTVEKYETCPLQFKLHKDWLIPGEVAAHMQYGNAVHTVLKDYYDAQRAGRPRSREEVCDLFLELLARTPFDDPLQRQLYERQGLEQLGVFLELREREPLPEVIDTERNFELKIGNVIVRGRVDRLDRISGDRIGIVDYKTGAPREQRSADESLQLSLYALAARDHWKLTPERLSFYNLADNSEVVTRRSAQELERAQERVLKAAHGIKAGVFDARPGYHCRRCAYRHLCPETEPKLYTIGLRVGVGTT